MTAWELDRDQLTVESQVRHAGRPVLVVWFALVLATLASWYLGDGHGATRLAGVVVIVTGFGKVALIGEHFMELRSAPPQLRFPFLAWCVLVPSLLCAMYVARS